VTDRCPRQIESTSGWAWWWRDGELEWELEWVADKFAWVRRMRVPPGGWNAYPIDLPEPDNENHAAQIVEEHVVGQT
jgi:hypothetical protein